MRRKKVKLTGYKGQKLTNIMLMILVGVVALGGLVWIGRKLDEKYGWVERLRVAIGPATITDESEDLVLDDSEEALEDASDTSAEE